MKRSNYQDNYDLIIIGAGNGGLTAGAAAAREGLKVMVLEQHNLPGGFASSFCRGRFEFEPALHEPCDIGYKDKLGTVGKYFKELGVDVDWVLLEEDAYRLVISGSAYKGMDVSMPFGFEEYTRKVIEYVPESEKSVRKFMSLCKEMRDSFFGLARLKGKFDPDYIMLNYPNFLRIAGCSVQEVLNACEVPEKAQVILAAYACYLGMPAGQLAFNVYGPMLMSYLECPVVLPRMRSHEISSALAEIIEKNGGRIEYNTRATKIHVSQGTVTGVETSQGDYFTASQVISNASPIFTYTRMVTPASEVPAMAIQETNARRQSSAAFVVFLGLNRSADELGLKDYSVFILRDSRLDSPLNAPTTDDIRCQAVVCLNRGVPDCSPEGTCIVTLTTLMEGDAWDTVTPQNYVETKNAIARRLIEEAEDELKVSLTPYIEEIEVATPATFANYAKAYNGVIYGYEQPPWDSFLIRSMTRKEEEKIRGLVFASAWGFRGAGYSSTYSCGEQVGRRVAQKMQKGGAK